MELEIRTKGVRLTKDLFERIERCLGFALGRRRDRVERVRVHLTDINGPRGGDDIRCQIEAQLSPTGTLIVHETRRNALEAVALCTRRVGRRLARHLERRQTKRRRRQMANRL